MLLVGQGNCGCSHPIKRLTSSDPSWHTKSQRDGAAPEDLLGSGSKTLMAAQYLLTVNQRQLCAPMR